MPLASTWHRFGTLVVLAVFAAGLSLALVGCDGDTEIETIFVEAPRFEEPPAEAQGFLGYDDQETRLTVCGNCHVGQQSGWQETAHASAWEDLQASGHASATCENCHTVGPLGNPTTDGGWATTADTRYHDVQCESCHGPGQAHVTDPDVEANHPIPSIAVGDLTDLANATSCAECHQGTHHPFAEEWAQSNHAIVGFQATRAGCDACHSGQGALKAWGVYDTYAEQNAAEPVPIVCAVCHDPHDARYEGQLRFPVKTASIEDHLCARCHDRRTIPDPNSSHGLEPHAPEAALLSGDAGWFPPNSEINQGQIIATHGSAVNERLCATCHVNSFEVTDAVTGNFLLNATGHLFSAVPCLDDQGLPTTSKDCEITTAARSFSGCTLSGCHGSEDAAAAALSVAGTRLRDRADELHELLEQVDPNGEDAGGAIDPADPSFTVAEGALFNYHLSLVDDRPYGAAAHNPFLMEALLIGSIQAVEAEYGVKANTRVNYDEEMERLRQRMPAPGSLTPVRRRSAPAPMPTLTSSRLGALTP